MEEKLRPGALLGLAAALFRENAVGAIVALLAVAAAGAAFDILVPDSYNNLPSTIASIVAEYVLTRQALARRGLILRMTGGGAGIVGLSFLTGLGIAAGCVLLIVPGVILALRWSASIPILLAEDVRVTESMGESWARTKGNMLPILIAYLPGVLVLVPFIALGVFSGLGQPIPPVAEALISNILVGAWLLFGIYVALAIYIAVRPAAHALEAVFA
jgi:hypothetical protein